MEDLSGLAEVRMQLTHSQRNFNSGQVQRAAERASVDIDWSEDADELEQDGEGEII